MRTKAIKVYLGILAAGLIYLLWILITGITIPCFYLTTTGMECGGCGITRMFESMVRLDFTAAFGYNPVMFILFFVWNIVGILCIWDKFRFVSNKRFLYILLGISIAVTIIYGFVRNFI